MLLCQLVAATLVGVIAAQVFGPLGVAIATAFEVVVIFVFSEAVPKQWAVRHSDRAALLAAPLVTTLVRFPPTRFVSGALIGLARLITPGGRSPQAATDVTESELLAFADVAALDEAIESDERVLIHSIIEFGDTIVREVMVPRPDVVAVEDSAETGAVLERAIEAGYSRIPVFNESLDDVIGIAFTKDLIRAARGGKEHCPVSEVCRPANYVPETKRVAPLMREMQAGQFHLAVVIDEYGGTAGVVTLEDLIEELVGEIFDEFDVDEPADRAPRWGPVPGLEQDGRGRGERASRARTARRGLGQHRWARAGRSRGTFRPKASRSRSTGIFSSPRSCRAGVSAVSGSCGSTALRCTPGPRTRTRSG